MVTQKILSIMSGLLICGDLLAISVPLGEAGGTYTVPVRLNDVITLDFVLDSGASEVQIPVDVVMTLLRANTINKNDFLDGTVYKLADGSSVKGERFVLRKVQIGEHALNNVTAGISPMGAELLLGQSVLARLLAPSEN